jgi:hypothetical protein
MPDSIPLRLRLKESLVDGEKFIAADGNNPDAATTPGEWMTTESLRPLFGHPKTLSEKT